MKKIILLLPFIWGNAICAQVLPEVSAEDLDLGFTTYNEGQDFTAITVGDNNSRVWAGTRRAGIFNIVLPPKFSQEASLSKPTGIFTEFTIFDGPQFSEVSINSMDSDNLGNVWVAHSGTTNKEGNGGIERINSDLNVKHFAGDANALGLSYTKREGLGTRDVRSITVDPNNTIWAAQGSDNIFIQGNLIITSGTPTITPGLGGLGAVITPTIGPPTISGGSSDVTTPGTISYKTAGNDNNFISKGTWFNPETGTLANPTKELPYPAYTVNPPSDKTAQTRNMQAISADNKEVWVGAWQYTYVDDQGTSTKNDDVEVTVPYRILRYNLDGTYKPSGSAMAGNESGLGFTYEDMKFPLSIGVINNIYRNNNKGTWVTKTITDRGFSVFVEEVDANGVIKEEWKYIDPKAGGMDKVIPPLTRFNNNAIWGNAYGNVFMGSNNGLLVYDGRGAVDEPSSYTLYSKTDIIPGSPFVVVDPNMVSNNITAGVSQDEGIQWMATDNGIMRVRLGHIKTDPNVKIADEKWRTRNQFCGENTDQYLSSIRETKNVIVREVETALEKQDGTYHCYQVETTIHDPRINPTDNKNGTVENVFHMLKEYSMFQAIIPLDFPQEVPGDDFLREISDTEVVFFEATVNRQLDQIVKIEDIMKQNSSLSKYGSSDITNSGALFYIGLWTGGFDFPVFASEIFGIEGLTELHINSNNRRSIHETAEYKLFHVPQTIEARNVFDDNFTNFLVEDAKTRENCQGDGLRDIYFDPVIMHIDDTNYTIVNYTKPGHYFHPGKITRTVVRDTNTGEVYIRTIGEGEHFCKGKIDDDTGEPVKNHLGQLSAKLNTIMGTILFKNVDIRVREAFKKL